MIIIQGFLANIHVPCSAPLATEGRIDYAHRKLGFPTWHRLYLLSVENEIRITLNKPNFTLIYWDWTNPMETELILTRNRLGESVGGMVKGELFDEGWEVICWNTTGICDPKESPKANLTRCQNETKCSVEYREWPTKENVTEALDIESYTEYPYDIRAVNSFSNRLEGFIPPTDPTQKGKFGRGLHNIVSTVSEISEMNTCIAIYNVHPCWAHCSNLNRCRALVHFHGPVCHILRI